MDSASSPKAGQRAPRWTSQGNKRQQPLGDGGDVRAGEAPSVETWHRVSTF